MAAILLAESRTTGNPQLWPCWGFCKPCFVGLNYINTLSLRHGVTGGKTVKDLLQLSLNCDL